MSNIYVVHVASLSSGNSNRISEGLFLSTLAEAEKHFKNVLVEENLRCPRCKLILGYNFKLGVRTSTNMKTEPKLTFFAAHSSCMDDRLHGEITINEDSELEITALAFLELEETLLSHQNELDKNLDMIELNQINGEWKVVVKYEKAGKGFKDKFQEAAMIRFKEIEKLGVVIKCPTCQKGFQNNQERFIAFIPNGPGKNANVEMVHQHCHKKFRKMIQRRAI